MNNLSQEIKGNISEIISENSGYLKPKMTSAAVIFLILTIMAFFPVFAPLFFIPILISSQLFEYFDPSQLITLLIVVFLFSFLIWLFLLKTTLTMMSKIGYEQAERFVELLTPIAKKIIEQKYKSVNVTKVKITDCGGSVIEYEFKGKIFIINIKKVVCKNSKKISRNIGDAIGTIGTIAGSAALSLVLGDGELLSSGAEHKQYITTDILNSVTTNKFSEVEDLSFKLGNGFKKPNTESIDFNELYSVDGKDEKNIFLFFTPKNMENLINNKNLFANKIFNVNNNNFEYSKQKEQSFTRYTRKITPQFKNAPSSKRKLRKFAEELLEQSIDISLSELNEFTKCTMALEI